MTVSGTEEPGDRDVLRIQAAVVAAQHAALFEREAQLRQREEALIQREREVAARLDEKRRAVDDLQNQLSNSREKLRLEREEITRLRAETHAAHGEAEARRDRLRSLHTRFVRRLKRHWAAERKSLQTRGREQERQQDHLKAEAERLRRERDIFERFRRKFHSQAELEKRRLQGERQQLDEEHQRGRLERREGEAALAQQENRIEAAKRELRSAQAQWESQRQGQEHLRAALRAEIQGLENRIAGARRHLLSQAQSADAATLVPAPSSQKVELKLLPLPETFESAFALRDEYQSKRQAALERQAAALVDQRLHLAELYERLARAEQEWHSRQADAAAELERLALDLQRQEESLRERSRTAEAAGERNRQEREALQRRRRELERSAAELHARQAEWQGEQRRRLAELERNERLAERRLAALPELFRRWRVARTREVEQVRRILDASLDARREWAEQVDEARRRSQALREGQEALAGQALALEEARQELLQQQSGDPRKAAKRLERLRRRADGQLAAARRELKKQRAAQEAEAARYEERFRGIQAQLSDVVRRERDVASARDELDLRVLESADQQRLHELFRAAWDRQQQAYEQEVAGLREEIERLARLLMEDGGAADVIAAAA
jgi:hypothetical protein